MKYMLLIQQGDAEAGDIEAALDLVDHLELDRYHYLQTELRG